MDNNRELPVGSWVDERLATLSPDSKWQPNTDKGLVRLRELRDAGRRRRWIWGVAASAAVSLSLMAALPAPRVFAERCLNYCSAALSLNSSTSDPASLVLPGLEGADATLEQYKGKVVLVNFWATWCQPCNTEIPWLIEFNQKYGPRGLVVLGVAMDDEGKRTVEPWVTTRRFDVDGHPELMNYPILLGNDKIAEKFGATIGLPTSFLYSRDGKRIKTILGLLNHDDLQRAIEGQL